MGKRIRAGSDPYEPQRTGSPLPWLILLVLALLVVGAAWWFGRSPDDFARAVQAVRQIVGQQPAAPDEIPASTPTAADGDQATEPTPTDVLALEGDEPQNPIEPPEDAPLQPLPPLEASDPVVADTFAAWVGPDQARSFIQNERFVRRFVATVDNLTAPRAPTLMWPVHPTSPRFTVEDSGSGSDAHIATANSARYAAAVQFAQRIDAAEAARQYRQYYPLFQQAYEELGYPNRYFNDRLIAVIDHLLQAPEPVAPRVRLMQVRGSFESEQPWVRYEFEDPQLEALSAGQKILVRIGPANARVVKAKLREFRAQIAHADTAADAAAPATSPPGDAQ